ncbi:MAG TPA: molybdopterin dinucleotide binding domain-containing protein, partial [bacterium]|nr:molybdopterin dinucleotide binding domain-containing protein [bacterium]
PAPPPDGYFRLLYGRAPVHSFSRTQSNRVLMDMLDENEVWINQDIATRWGLKTGDYIRLKNQDGVISNRIKIKATERIRADCVYIIHGFGHNARQLTYAYQKGASDAQLITRYKTDPIMGGTAMNVNFVTFELEA